MTPPSDLELQVLSVLWRDGPSTARDVLGALPDGKQRAYTGLLAGKRLGGGVEGDALEWRGAG